MELEVVGLSLAQMAYTLWIHFVASYKRIEQCIRVFPNPFDERSHNASSSTVVMH